MHGDRPQRCTSGHHDAPPAPATPPTRPRPAAGPTPSGLTVARVVAPGAAVALDDSWPVHSLLDAVLAARPALVGSTSLAAVHALTTSAAAREGVLTVRLFGGAYAGGACDGPRAVADTRCDVALLSGRLVGGTVHVPADVRPTRLALLACTRRCYLVLPAADTDVVPAGWLPLAALGSFDGIVELPASTPAETGRVAPIDGPRQRTTPGASVPPV